MKSDLSEMFEEGVGEPQKLDRLTKLLIVFWVVAFIGGLVLASYLGIEVIL